MHHLSFRKESRLDFLGEIKPNTQNYLYSHITWLPGPIKGMFFYLYLVLDLFSRKIVAWEIWTEESAENARHLIRRAVISEQVKPSQQPLVLHSDNGSPMKGTTLLQTLFALGIEPSRSRPRVNNDNPYAESVFRTCKYRPTYPSNGFATLHEARDWVLNFVRWYNHEHKHSSLKFVTPAQRHSGQDHDILQKRREVYEEAKQKTQKDGLKRLEIGILKTRFGSIQKRSKIR